LDLVAVGKFYPFKSLRPYSDRPFGGEVILPNGRKIFVNLKKLPEGARGIKTYQFSGKATLKVSEGREIIVLDADRAVEVEAKGFICNACLCGQVIRLSEKEAVKGDKKSKTGRYYLLKVKDIEAESGSPITAVIDAEKIAEGQALQSLESGDTLFCSGPLKWNKSGRPFLFCLHFTRITSGLKRQSLKLSVEIDLPQTDL